MPPKQTTDWFQSLSPDSQKFIKQFLLADGKFKILESQTGFSYNALRTKLTDVICEISTIEARQQNTFKPYLNFLVKEEILRPSIAEAIYQKYKENMEDQS